jgi:hypothetical protein
MNDPKQGTVVICETRTSTWSYHLRIIGPEGFKPGGGDLTSICNKKMGWDTRVPLSAWGKPGNTPAHWCKECEQIISVAALKE